MIIETSRRQVRRCGLGTRLATTVIALAVGFGASAAVGAGAPAAGHARELQSRTDDPCRYSTAEAMGTAFGRALKSSTLGNVCQYRGAGADVVVVKVAAGTEGTILRHARGASSQTQSGVEKVATPAGEAYFDSTLPVFIGRVGDREVQIETTIQPLPRDAMIAVGRRIMEAIARQ